MVESVDAIPEHASLGSRFEARLKRLTGSPLFWFAFLGVLFSYPIISSISRQVPKPPPVMFALPEFSLRDHLGNEFGSKELRGKVWVANFIFTNCPTMCPELTATMAKVQKRMRNMGDAVMLISLSVDPERDTPEKLNEYAKKFQANPRRWRFLTGDLSKVEAAVVKGFKMPMEKGATAPDGTIMDITHGSRLVLVDQDNNVRGFYETDPNSLDDLVSDLAAVANHLK